MNDIIVTTPKSAIKNAAKEAEDAIAGRCTHYYRQYRVPPPVSKGSRVYYVEDGFIRGFALVDFVELNGASRVMMRCDSWKWIKPIPMRGFQNWRYMKIRKENIQVIGNWFDPMPKIAKSLRP